MPNSLAYQREWQKKHRLENPDTIKGYKLKDSFGITLDQYNQWFIQQEGKCKICGKHQTELARALAVDHCHNTKVIRGLLCAPCNAGLGHFRDNPDVLEAAINYLKSGNVYAFAKK